MTGHEDRRPFVRSRADRAPGVNPRATPPIQREPAAPLPSSWWHVAAWCLIAGSALSLPFLPESPHAWIAVVAVLAANVAVYLTHRRSSP